MILGSDTNAMAEPTKKGPFSPDELYSLTVCCTKSIYTTISCISGPLVTRITGGGPVIG